MSADKFYTTYFIAIDKDNGLYERPLLKMGTLQVAPWHNPIFPEHGPTLASSIEPAKRAIRVTSKIHDPKLGLLEGVFDYYNPNVLQPPAPGREQLHTPSSLEESIEIKNIVWTGWHRPEIVALNALREKYGCQSLTESLPHYHLMENEQGGEHSLVVIRSFLAEPGTLLVPDKSIALPQELIESGLSFQPIRSSIAPSLDAKLGKIFVLLFHTESQNIFESPTNWIDQNPIVDSAVILKTAKKEITISGMTLHDFPTAPTPEGLARIRGRYMRVTSNKGAKPS